MEDNSSYLVVGSIDGKLLLRADPVAMWDVAGLRAGLTWYRGVSETSLMFQLTKIVIIPAAFFRPFVTTFFNKATPWVSTFVFIYFASTRNTVIILCGV